MGIKTSKSDLLNNIHTMDDFGLPEEILRYSHYNYNLLLAYGFEFDIVRLYMSGNRKYELGERFYELNDLYSNPILKLHGSLNWVKFSNTPISVVHPNLNQDYVGKHIISEEYWNLYFASDLKGWIVSPNIITSHIV